jgi:hypothetical protein
MVDPAQTLKIGGYAYEGSALGNQEFAGRIAAAGVWSRALTHLEVQTLGASPHVLLRPRCQRWARRFADSPFVARAGQIQVTGQQRGEVCLTGQEVGEAYLTGRAAALASTSGPAAGQISLAGQIAGEAA